MNCLKCGQLIPDDSDFCQYCGSRITTGKIALQYDDLEEEGSEESIASTSEQDHVFSPQETAISLQEAKISMQEREKEELENAADEAIRQLHTCIAKLRFYDKNVVIVPDDGKLLYHKYGCEELDLSSFWIYNTKLAEANSYKPCDYCCK